MIIMVSKDLYSDVIFMNGDRGVSYEEKNSLYRVFLPSAFHAPDDSCSDHSSKIRSKNNDEGLDVFARDHYKTTS